MKYHIQP